MPKTDNKKHTGFKFAGVLAIGVAAGTLIYRNRRKNRALKNNKIKEAEKLSKEDNTKKSLSILVVCQYYYPENFQIIDICEELVRKGHRVTVLTGLPNYPTGNIPDEYKHRKKRDEYINGVHVVKCYEIGRKKGIKRIALNYASYCISSSIKAIGESFEFDVIYSYQLSPVFMVLPAVMLKKKYKKPIFLYCCDLWPESMKMMLKDEDSAMFRMVSKVSTFLYKECDRIAVQSEDFFEYFEKVHDIPIEKLRYIPQMGDDNYISQNFNEPHEGINFVFLGNVGIAQDMDCILRAVRILKGKNFTIHIVGDGTYLDECKRLAREYDIEDKIVFYGRRPVEEMPKFYRLADACLLTLKDDTWIGRTIPAKLQGYMAAGKPVIGAINGAAQKIIREADCGLCVSAGDFEALAASMEKFITHQSDFIEAGERGRVYFEKHFTKKIHVHSIEKELYELVGGK